MSERGPANIAPELCLSRGEVIRLIPEVKPNLAGQAIEDAIFAQVLGEPYRGLTLTEEDVAEVSYGGEGERRVLTPNGARLLRKLFEAGLIEQRRPGASRDLSALDAYIASEAELRDRTLELRLRREAKDGAWEVLDARAREIAEDPSCATIEDLSPRMIDRVFIHRFGYGREGEIELAGCTCHKAIERYVSNSGKTRTSTAYCWWEDADGGRHGNTPPDLPRNRRSDPDRNWGLGPD